MKRGLLIGLLLLGAAASWYAWQYYASAKTEKWVWRKATVEVGNVSTIITATGNLSAVTTVQVGTQISGTISKLLVDFNSVVKRGQIIARLDTTLLAAARLDAEASYDKARAQLVYTELELKRNSALLKQAFVSQADFDQASANNEVAQSTVKSAFAQLSHARINVQNATIRAPIDGTVISRTVDVGQTVIASMNAPTLFTIANDLTKMQVQANVDEADIGQVQVGQAVVFSVDAYPNDVFRGSVQQIRLQPVMVQNVVNYIVIVDVDNADKKLMPGLTASIRIQVQSHDNVLTIPTAALHFNPPVAYFDAGFLADSVVKTYRDRKVSMLESPKEGSTVIIWLVRTKDVLEPVSVQVGLTDGIVVELKGAVQAGDVVVTGVDDGTKSVVAQQQSPFMPQMPSSKRSR